MKAYTIVGVLAFIIFLYAGLPSLYFRHYSSSVKRKFSSNNSIFLTFDDGPNPAYTLEILDLLKEYNVKATFFVVARKAEEHKEIIDRIVEDGHTLAMHSYSHKSAWLSTPWQTKKDFEKSMSIFNKLGYEIKYFRPPWGVFNGFTQYYSSKNGLKSIFWTIITEDWNPKATVDSTVHKILDNVESGDIIVLHDSNHKDDKKDAPKNTIKALETIIPALLKRDFYFKTIEEGMESNI
ncbi:polysaccharide deacetylase family protein [Anaerosalibacter massiliensis]|uniref:Polysaccharide deacetylase family protein n=1 Tax=Anaerosalibacter massiliensis TaxID=1347392 RepID=A0A9X2S622_9FIRM|nr:polysaccharide deacetylase family protein [Anaerosalibacter massiliensis]MCR2044894.1 polysaccharide deacetylase family protein [Anaerosalibacter massiliensis]